MGKVISDPEEVVVVRSKGGRFKRYCTDRMHIAWQMIRSGCRNEDQEGAKNNYLSRTTK